MNEPASYELHITRPDEFIPVLFDNEIRRYKRGFTFGMFGSANIKTGGGKSVATYQMCQEYDPTFNIDRVCLTPSDLLTQLAEIEDKRMHGACVVFEEAQNFASNRTWFSLYNKTIMHTIATFRYLRCGAFFITPMARMIDGDVRKLMRFHAVSRLVASEGNNLEGYIRISEVITYNDDKNIGHMDLSAYIPEQGRLLHCEELRVFITDREFLKQVEKKVTDYKKNYRMDLKKEAEAFENAQHNLYKKMGTINPQELAGEMLKDRTVVKELARRGKIDTVAVSGFYPNMDKDKDRAAVKWWVNKLWEDLKVQK